MKIVICWNIICSSVKSKWIPALTIIKQSDFKNILKRNCDILKMDCDLTPKKFYLRNSVFAWIALVVKVTVAWHHG